MKFSALPRLSRRAVSAALLSSGLSALAILFPMALRGQSIYSTPYTLTTLAGVPGVSGTNDGTGGAAHFKYPVALALDTNGNLYVADWGNFTIRELTLAGVVTALAGLPGVSGTNDGTGDAARFSALEGIAVDGSTNIYVTDRDNDEIRKVTPMGTNWMVTTLAGLAGSEGTNDGTNVGARFNGPWGVDVGTNGDLYVSDFYNHTIRKMTQSGTNWVVTTLAGLAGSQGTNDGTNGGARFNYPAGVALDSEGDVFVADSGNFTIRKVVSSGTNWMVTTLAGVALRGSSADGTGSAALFDTPTGVVLDSATNVYVSDFYNHTIRTGFPDGSVPMPVLQLPGLDGGLFSFRISGLPNLAVDLQNSVDLANWQVIGSVVLVGGSNYFLGSSPPQGMQFYRARVR